MPRLGIELDNDINKTTNDFKKLNSEVDKTDKGVNKIDKSSQQLGKTMSTAFKAFLIGGALQKGFAKIIDDIDKGNRKAKELADSLRTLRFLGDDAEIASNRRLQQRLAKFGIGAQEVGPVQAEVLSTAGGLDIATREQILAGSAAGAAGGVGSFQGLSAATASVATLSPQFQSAEGITQVQNLLTQGITEAKLDPSQVEKLGRTIAIGFGAGLTPSESLSAFAILSRVNSPDEANSKFQQLTRLWISTGAKGQGFSFLEYVLAVGGKTDQQRTSEERTLGAEFTSITSAQADITGAQGRLEAARGGESLTLKAFGRQEADPQTRINIIQEEEAARISGVSSTARERAGTTSLSTQAEQFVLDITAVGERVLATYVEILSDTSRLRVADESDDPLVAGLRSAARQNEEQSAIKSGTINSLNNVIQSLDSTLSTNSVKANP